MKSLEELKAEAAKTQAALEAKLAEDRQAIARAEQEAKAEKARAQLEIARAEASLKADALVQALQAVGYDDAVYDWESAGKWDEYPVIKFTGDGTWATVVKFEDVMSNSKWHSHKTGTKVVIGGYGGKTFPQKKDGSFSYDKIAVAVREIHNSRTAKAVQEQKEKTRHEANKVIQQRICKAFGLSEYGSVSPAKYADNKVALKLELTLTEDQATQVLQALKDMKIEVR
jgi:anion-transporting  ArsA/GET3 family ATPase